MAAAFCSSSSSSITTPHHRPPSTPIEECERQGNEDSTYVHHPTPLHHNRHSKPTVKLTESGDAGVNSAYRGVSFNKCRPSVREKFSVVPLDTTTFGRHSMASPTAVFKSILSSVIKKSPRRTPWSEDVSPAPGNEEEQWKVAVAELSHKLIAATKQRDEAVLETSRMKSAMAEVEKKLNKLEIYCNNLKSGLEEYANQTTLMKHEPVKIGNHDMVIDHFLVSVTESRSSVRRLSRSLTVELRQVAGGKLYDRIQFLLQPYDIKISVSTNPKVLILYLEALLNRAFFEDFESSGFQKSGSTHTLNPIQRSCENFKSFIRLKKLTWEEVLTKGTKQFSVDFSKFCDRKLSEIVGMLGWTRVWPEPLLHAFFVASKAIWLVHLLANSVHPGLPIFRVDKGVQFDPVYMEDVGGDKTMKFAPQTVRVMVEPGFYIYGNVVKCKVLRKRENNNEFKTVSPNANFL